MVNADYTLKQDNIVREKSFEFAIRVVKLSKGLAEERKEFIMSKQLLRSGTSVGAMVREAEHAESKNDFIHKLGIAQKEINETIYWLELLRATDYLEETEFQEVHVKAVEVIKLITAIIKSAKMNLNRSVN
ncbi:MAG: four helix bundle protein [Cyclobacteriaceae bacterium]